MSPANKIFTQVRKIGEISPRHHLPHSQSPVNLVFTMSNATAAVTKTLTTIAKGVQFDRMFDADGAVLKESAAGTTWESAQ
jgi:hypothetical protein